MNQNQVIQRLRESVGTCFWKSRFRDGSIPCVCGCAIIGPLYLHEDGRIRIFKYAVTNHNDCAEPLDLEAAISILQIIAEQWEKRHPEGALKQEKDEFGHLVFNYGGVHCCVRKKSRMEDGRPVFVGFTTTPDDGAVYTNHDDACQAARLALRDYLQKQLNP